MTNRVLSSFATAVVLTSAACGGMTLHSPPNGATINTSTVSVRATWTDIQGSPDFTLDNVDVTSSFTINTTTEEATASLTVTPGTHTIRFGANSFCSYCNPKYQRRVLSSTFTVTGPPAPTISLAVTPATVELPRGGSATVNAAITRSTTVTGAVTLSMSAVPGVTTTFTQPGTGNSGTITLTAAPGASLGTTNATVTATGPMGSPTDNDGLNVKVGPRLGAFNEVVPNISAAGVTANSPQGGHRVRITTGAAVGSNHPFAATFETSNGQNRGVAFFYQGAAGFCAGDSAGVVLTNNGNAFGQSSSHMFSIAYFPRGTPVMDRPAETAGGGNSVVQPRIFFSPDCSLAIIAHGNRAGTTPYVVSAMDLRTGSLIGQSVEANMITPATLARVLYQGGRVQMEIRTDLQTVMFPIP